MNFLDLSDDHVKLDIDVYESVIGQSGVLAKFKGTFFVPDGVSRNKRFYPEGLWKKAIGSVKESLQDGMLGTLLHPEKDSKFAHAIYASHVVKDLWIDKNKRGLGEAYIMDTPVGKVVDTFRKTGLIKLYVSSRAWGKYQEGKTKDGMPVVDEDNYVLKTFDIVLEPGFLQAAPSFGVKEQLEQLAECYLYKVDEMNAPKIERESTARKLIRDIDHAMKDL